MLSYSKGIHLFDQECNQKYGKLWGVYDGRQPVLCILDRELIRTVLVKECFTHFTNRRNMVLSGDLHDALFNTVDEDWKRIRAVISPSFTSGRLKEMFVIMKTCSKNLMRSLQKDADLGRPTDTKECYGAYSMDLVSSISLSVDIDSLNNPSDPFVVNVKKLLGLNVMNPLFLIVAFFPFMDPLLSKMGFSLFPKSVTRFFFAAFQRMKSERENGSYKKRADLLQFMMDSQKETSKGGNKGMTDSEILSQSLVFIFGGFDTTNSVLCFTLHALATHPDIMKKLQEEVDSVFPEKAEVSYEPLMQMEYLDCVINETMRLYAPFPRIERMCKKTVEINGLTIPKGTAVAVPAFILQRDPELWMDPERFNPERFSQENRASIDSYSYMPFGLGPRNCLGMRFAMMSIKLAIVETLQRYDITNCPETEVPLEVSTMALTSAKRPVKVQMVPR